MATLTAKFMNGFYSFDSAFYTFYYNPADSNTLEFSRNGRLYSRFQQTDSFYLVGDYTDGGVRTKVILDPQTHYVREIMGISYEYVNGRLDVLIANKGQTQPNGDSLEIRGPYFHYDDNGNLESIGTEALGTCGATGNVGIRYTHDNSHEGTGKTIIPILTVENSTYTISEIMDWLPPAHKNLVTSFEYICGYGAFGDLSIPLRFDISDHVINEKKQVVSFKISDASTTEVTPDSRIITNNYDCVDVWKKE